MHLESARLEEIGIGRPLKDELEIKEFEPKAKEVEGDITTEDETELDHVKRPKKGAGWVGVGPTLHPLRKGIPKPFVDGAGHCSPGRWPVARRNLPDNEIAKELRNIVLAALKKFEASLATSKPPMDFKRLLMTIAVGKMDGQPFPQELVEETRMDLRLALRRAGFGDGLPVEDDAVQKFEVRLIQALLSAFDDPDSYFCSWWAVGVWLGSPKRKLPRTPAVFDRKTKWRFPEPDEDERGDWQRNYSSIANHADLVKKQFEAEKSEGLMTTMRLGDAIAESGSDLMIAATGAIDKKGRSDEVRVIFDGSHGTALNPGIRVRDQVRYPTAADGRALLEEVADEGGPHFSLHYDVAKAHRQVPVLRCEWGRQACQISGTAARAAQEIRKKLAEAERREFETHGRSKGTAPEIDWLSELPQEVLDEEIWLNTVGTFGVGSAGYWWGRAGACVIRLSHYLQGFQHAIWTMLYSDDGWLIGRTERYEVGLILHLFILVLIGTPLAWHKLCGGVESEWVGYALDVGRFQIGISLLRAQWAVRWCGDKVRERRVRLGELREGLGRLQFLAGPLEHLRPFLGPLYAWSCAGARFARPKLPVMLLLILKYIGEELQRGSMAECRSRTKHLGEMFRLDAKAEGENVAIGGWRCKEGRSTRNSEWFAVELNRRNAPWAFARGEAFRTIASLELLGALVSVMTLLPIAEVRTASVGLATLSCGTDNQGNSYLLDKLMTTKYPLGIVLMELACQLGLRRACLHARWIPRLQNEEADALTNGEFDHFDLKLRIPVELDKLRFLVMDQLFDAGEDYVKELADLKAAEREKKRKAEGSAPERKAKKGPTLRERQPW